MDTDKHTDTDRHTQLHRHTDTHRHREQKPALQNCNGARTQRHINTETQTDDELVMTMMTMMMMTMMTMMMMIMMTMMMTTMMTMIEIA